jgi:hypothetical protein
MYAISDCSVLASHDCETSEKKKKKGKRQMTFLGTHLFALLANHRLTLLRQGGV